LARNGLLAVRGLLRIAGLLRVLRLLAVRGLLRIPRLLRVLLLLTVCGLLRISRLRLLSVAGLAVRGLLPVPLRGVRIRAGAGLVLTRHHDDARDYERADG
jgi:hypothetical protein